jgi:hypothetical protein
VTPLDGARTWLAGHGWQVIYVEDGPDGRLNRDTVEVRAGQDPDIELLVLLHEMAHVLEDAPPRTFSYPEMARREVSAETSAATAARLLGVDVVKYSELYLATFPGVVPQRNAGFVGRVIADSVRAQ